MERLRVNAHPVADAFAPRRISDSDVPHDVPTAAPAVPTAAAPANAEPPAEQSLAQAFVLNQQTVYPMYTAAEGLCRGTVFMSLDKPFKGGIRCETR